MEYKWVEEVKNDPSLAFCKFCNQPIKINYSGKAQLQSHSHSRAHEDCIKNLKNCRINHFQDKSNWQINNDDMIAEYTLCYHVVKHHESYRSMDCSSDLFKECFFDSKFAKSIKCKRTKTSEIIQNLSAISTKIHINNGNTKYYSVSTDGSTFFNNLIYPIFVTY